MANVPISGLPVGTGPMTGNETFPGTSGGVTYQWALSQMLEAVPGGYVPNTRAINTTAPIQGGGTLDTDLTLSLAASGATAGTYGNSTNVPQITVDGFGRITSVVNVAVSFAGYVPDTRQVIAGTGLSGGGALSSDVTLNLANTAVTPASYGSGTTVGTFTVDAQGRLTAAASTAIDVPGSGGVPDTRQVIAGTGLSGGGALSSDVTLNLANTAVTPAAYGGAATVGTFTVDAQGRLTAAADVAIAIANTAVSGLGTASTQNTGTSGATLPFLNGANTWSAQQTITTSSSFGVVLDLQGTNAGAGGATMSLYHNSASPAANDASFFTFDFNNTTPARFTGAWLIPNLLDATAGSEDVELQVQTIVNGATFQKAAKFGDGAQFGAPTGGYQGIGTTNATGRYRNGVLTGWVLVGTLTTTSGATQSITGLPVADAYMLVWNDVSHNDAGSQYFTIAVSDDNGSTYGTAFQVTNAVGPSNRIHGRAFITGCSVAAQNKIVSPSLGGVGAVVCYNTTGVESTKTGATSAIQVGVSASAFDNGAIYVYSLI